MSEVIIRRAVREDCPRLLELIKGLAIHQGYPNEVTATLEHFEDSGFGNSPIWHAFVAELDGVVYGFALWYIRYSTWKGQRLYLEDFYVDPSKRSLGIGAMLFERLIQEGKTLGLNGMVWQVMSWNEPAIRFYEKYGATFNDKQLDCSLDFNR